MSYEGKHASSNNGCHMVVAADDLEIVKASKKTGRSEVMWGAGKILFVSHTYSIK